MMHILSTNEEPTTSKVMMSGHKRPLRQMKTTEDVANNVYHDEEQPKKKQRTATATATATVANKITKNTKSVHFGNDNEVHVVPRVDEADIPLVWYSKAEFKHANICNNIHTIKFHTLCDKTYHKELLQVVGATYGKTMTPTLKDSLVALVDSTCRGLEKEMTPYFRQSKKQIVANVLQSHAALTAWKQSTLLKATELDQAKIHKAEQTLALHYQKLALPASRFARLLATGDALVVER